MHVAGFPRILSRCCHLQRSLCACPCCWAVQSCSHPAAVQCTARPASQMRLRKRWQHKSGRSRRVAITPFCIDLQLDQFRQTLKSHLQISIIQFCLQLLPCHTCEVVGTKNCPLPVCASHSSSPLHWVPLDSVTSLSMVEIGKSLRSFSFLGLEHFYFFFQILDSIIVLVFIQVEKQPPHWECSKLYLPLYLSA